MNAGNVGMSPGIGYRLEHIVSAYPMAGRPQMGCHG